MSAGPVIVTIGAHHQGPYVEQLLALAERCGAIVAVVRSEPERLVRGPVGPKVRPPQLHRQRFRYAGFDQGEANTKAMAVWR